MKKFLLSLVALLGVLNAQAAWEKVTTLAVGDVVVLAFDNETVSKELSEISLAGQNMIGKVEDYSGAPAGLYPLTVVAGSAENSLAFMNGSVYLSWSSGNTLTTSEEISDASSWTVEFDANGKAIISNVGTTARKLQYNTGSPRFACYTGSQQNAYLWKEVAGDAVAKPVLTASASFVESIEVTMSAAEGATIHFTQDGTEPTAESATYTEPLTITATTIVKAIAVVGEKSSAVAEATYTQLTKITLAEAQTAEAGTSVFVEGTVVASAASGAVIYDGTDYLYYYNNSNALTVGQKVRMIGTLASFGGANQMPNSAEVTVLDTEDVVYPAAVALDGAALDAIKTAGVVTRQYASMLGTLTISGNYFNVAVEGAAEAVGSIVKPNEDLAELNGETVKITGYVMYVNKKYVYFVATSVEKVKTTLDNAGFEVSDESNAIGIRTYQKDIKDEEVAQMQEVTGWTIVENGDARAAGVFAYGSESFLGGEGFVAPAAQYAFEEGAAKALGIIAVWSASLQYIQEVYLAPGNYMLQVPVYNAGGTGAVASNLIGAAGTYASTTQYPVGQWSVSNVEFTVEAAQTVTFSLGYKAAGAGSGSMPHLFIESATLFSGDEAIATAKETADTRVAALNATIALDKAKATKLAALDAMVAGEGLFQCSQEAIDLAKRAVNAATTVEEVEAASPALTQPDAEKQYSFQLKDGGKYMAVNEGIKLADQAYPFSFVQVEGGWALKDGDAYVAMTGTGSNVWSMGTTADPYAWAVSALGDGYYTLAKASNAAQLIGVDNVETGSACYADKGAGDKSSWAIAEYVAPAPPATEDYTDHIANANLTGEGGFDATGTKGIDGSGIVKCATNAQFDFKQTITALPAGQYKLTAQAAYRYSGSEADEYAAINAGTDTKLATLYATTAKKTYDSKVMNRYDGASDTDYAAGDGSTTVNEKFVPNSSNAVKAWFAAGQYVNEVIFNLAEAGDVTIGIVKNAQPDAGDYTVIGPWTLTRLGDAEEEPEPTPDPTPDPTDYTSSIVNPSFETGDLTGWTVGSSSDTGVKPNSNATYTTEGCDGDYLFNTWWQGIPITQTVTGLPNGLYELKALMANDAGEGNADKPCLYLLANGTHSEAFGSGTKSKFTECSMQFYVTDGTATIGAIGGNTDGSFNEAGYYWYKVDNFRLTFIEALPNIDDIVIPEGKMSNAAATAITTAKEAGDVIALLDAVKVAQVSIVAYASAANAIADAKAIAANTNVYTAEAYETFAAAIEGVENAYNDGTLSDEAAAAAGATLGTVVTGWRAGAEGAAVKFMESAYNLNGFDGALYVNTWSTEGYSDGSDFAVPFYEYFTGGDQALAPQTFTTTVTGLEAGSYEVSALIRVQLKDGETVPAGITLDGNGGAAVDALGEEATSANLFLKETTTLATVGADGVLNININVLEGNNVHWLSFKNVKYAAKDETEYAYEQALASIEDGKTYRIFTEVGEKKFYLNTAGYLVADANKAASFTFAEVNVAGTLYETGINLGCKFTNPSLTNGSTGDIVKKGHIIVGGNDRNDWERQVFFLKDGKYAVRATNANSENWGANTYWTVDNVEAELPNAEYALTPSYVWQIETNVDLRPEAFEKTKTWLTKLQAAEGLVTEGSQWYSNAKEPSEGSYGALLDGEYTTFFHSSWSVSVEDDHYLEATLPEAVQDFYFYMKKRSQNNNNRPTDIVITASNDGENFADVTEINEGLPTGATPLDYMSDKISMDQAYSKIRFTVKATSTGTKFFTASEWYILPSNELTDAALPYLAYTDYTDLADEDVEAINTLDAQIEAAYQQAQLKEELADLAACVARAKEFVAAYPAADAEALVQDATTTLERLGNGEYTTKEEIASAKSMAITAVKLFVSAAGTPTKDTDITEWFIVNPTPTTNGDGWTITNASGAPAAANAYDPVNNNAEFWNQLGYTIAQTVVLPAGEYKLTAVAYTRTAGTANGYTFDDMNAVLKAGDAQMTIALLSPTEVNGRAAGKTKMDEGLCDNELKFVVAETGEIVISLTSDPTQNDAWTVWRSFKIEKLAPAAPESVDYAGILEQTVVNRQTGEQVGETTTDDQTITLIDAGEGLVDIKVNGGFKLPIGMTIPEFTIKGVTVVVSQETASATYSYEGSVTIQNGMMTSTYDVTLTGYQASVEATPVFCVVLTQALIDTIYFGADQNAIDAYKQAVGIKGIKAASENAAIYDLSGRKVEKMVKGGIYIVNGKKVSFK